MNSNKKLYLRCKDYTVSNKEFELLYNSEFEMLETFPQPKGEELASYYESNDYISHTDAKKSFTDKLYQIVKNFTLKKKLKLINSFDPFEKNILDVGCGTGEFLLTCRNNNWNVVGVEPNKKAQNLTNSKLKNSDAKFIFSDIYELSNKQFDVITLWHVLEHVPNLEGYISTLKSLLKPNGVLVIAVPNFNSYDALHYKQFWAAFDVPRHLWHFSKKSIQVLVERQKMNVVKTLPMKFDSFYVSMLSEKYKSGKGSLVKAFLYWLYVKFKSDKNKRVFLPNLHH